MYNQIKKLASAVHNNILGGLSGYHTNFSISMELLEDTIVNERLLIIKEYSALGVLSPKDLYLSVNCIPVDCANIEKCKCRDYEGTPTAHFEIPLLLTELGDSCILYIGAPDKQLPFIYYTTPSSFRYHKYRKRGKSKPYVWIDVTPNSNGMYDCFVFNAPLLDIVSITGVFKDPRQLELYGCCEELQDDNKSYIDALIVDRVSLKMFTYYRLAYMNPVPNNQSYTPA